MKYYIALDGGTSNTRLRLIQNEDVISAEKLAMGAGTAGGKEKWSAEIVKSIGALLAKNALSEKDVVAVIASGMVTSEYGLMSMPHLSAPAGLSELAAGMKKTSLSGTDIPFFFIPGVKMLFDSAEKTDMMRGEEAEVMGLLTYGGKDCVYVLPGTHSKHVFVDGEGRISAFSTFMTGEMIAALSSATILRDAVDLSVEGFDADALLRGYDAAVAQGISAALFKTRIMKNLFSADARACYSFFLGALLSDEIRSLANSGASRALVAGKAALRLPTEYLLRERSRVHLVSCPEHAIENASVLGAVGIFEKRMTWDA